MTGAAPELGPAMAQPEPEARAVSDGGVPVPAPAPVGDPEPPSVEPSPSFEPSVAVLRTGNAVGGWHAFTFATRSAGTPAPPSAASPEPVAPAPLDVVDEGVVLPPGTGPSASTHNQAVGQSASVTHTVVLAWQ